MPEIVAKRKILRAVKSQGWMIQSSALAAMHNYLNLMDKDYLEDVISEMSQRCDRKTKLITESLWNDVIESNGTVAAINADDQFELVNSFDCPRLCYDTMRKTFRVDEKKWPLLGAVADKINMMAQRFALVHQRVLRHESFRQKNTSFPSGQANDTVLQRTLTPIESLLGKQDSKLVPVLVLGILTQIEEGKFYLEDPTGQVQVSFSNATAAEEFYITENSILLVEATFQDEILHVDCVFPPSLEQRDKSVQILQQQVGNSSFLPNSGVCDGSFVVLSDVHLDQPRVLELLEVLFKSYEPINGTDTLTDLPVFCFMGNFASSSHASIQQGFEDLAMLISKFETLAEKASFVFIPGPNDSNCSILPQAPLLQEMAGLSKTMIKIAHVQWGSNPCRLRRNGKEIVLFRYDVLAWMLQNQVRLPQGDEMNDKTPHSRMVRTILDQGHLLPVARVPIYWNYDHALRLYPLPDALVMGGSTHSDDHKELYERYENCDSIHPGSFSKNGTYVIYSPAGDELDTKPAGTDIGVAFCQATVNEEEYHGRRGKNAKASANPSAHEH